MFFLSILSLLGYTFAIKQRSRWSIEVIPLFVISLLTTLLYLAGLFNVLPFVAEFLVLFGVALLLLSPWYIDKTRWLSDYFTPGFLFIVLFCVFFGCFSANSHFHLWAEFSQWGARAKLIAIDKNLMTRSTVLAHYMYPPGAALFYYWFFVFSNFSEGIAHLGHQLLILLPLGIFVKNYSWNRWQRAFLVLTSAVLILLLFNVQMASNITLNANDVVGVFLGMILASYYYSERTEEDILFLFPVVFFFVTLKPDVFAFLFLICLIFIVDQCVLKSKKLWRQIAFTFLLLLVGFLSYWSWQLFMQRNDPGLIPHIQFWPSWSLSSHDVALADHFLRVVISYLPMIVAIILIVMANVLLAEGKARRKEIIWLHSFMLIGYFVYLGLLLALYLYSFHAILAYHFTSLYDYLKIYHIAWGLFAFATMLPEWRDSYFGHHRYITGTMIAMALIIFPTYLFYGHYLHLKSNRKQHSLLHLRRSLNPLVAAAKGIIPRHASVFIVWQDSVGFERVLLGYLLIPRRINPPPSSFGKPYSPEDKWTVDYSPKHLKQIIKNYDYVLLAYTDQPFWKTYGSLFKGRNQHQLVQYLICKRSGFNSFGKPGCWTQAAAAYLYRN